MTQPRRSSLETAIATYAIPAVLLVVALIQIHLAHRHYLSPWKGGGFGMFSTIDAPDRRFIRVTLVASTGEFAVDPTALGDPGLLRRVQSMPRGAWLRDIGALALRHQWTEGRDFEHPVAVPADPGDGTLAVHAIRVELMRLDVDRSERSMSLRVLRSCEVRREEGDLP
jgi:hypothetical protein